MNKEKGFTLLEILAVVVILGIISSIAYSLITGMLENSRERACVETRRGIIEAVRLQTFSEEISDEEAYNAIIAGDATYLDGEPVCIEEGEYIPVYNSDRELIDIACTEHGYISTSNQSLGSNYYRFEFEENDFNPIDYLQNRPHITVNDDGTMTANGGLVFMGTDGSDSYTIKTVADIHDNGNGFGILLETRLKLDSNGEPDPTEDYGYSLQFDPGLGTTVILRPRNDGRESNGPRIDLRQFFDYENGSEIDLDWMREQHEIEVKVVTEDATTKKVLMVIDGVEIKGSNIDGGSGYTATMTFDPEDAQGYSESTYTGIRTWHRDVEFEDFEYRAE